MREDENEDTEWANSGDEQKPALIVESLQAALPGYFDKMSFWATKFHNEDEKLALAKAAWQVCRPLKILSRYDVTSYFWFSTVFGIYFHEDMRWGDNMAMLRNQAIPERERIKQLNRNISPIYWEIFKTKDGETDFFDRVQYCFRKANLLADLPMQISNPVRFTEGFCRVFWPEFIDAMPDHYFQLMAMPMQKFCDKHNLGSWELMLCLGAAAVLGEFFMEDARYSKFRAMLLDKTGARGRDKFINIIETAQNYLNNIEPEN